MSVSLEAERLGLIESSAEWSEDDPASCARALVARCGTIREAAQRTGIGARTLVRWVLGQCVPAPQPMQVMLSHLTGDAGRRERVELYAQRVARGLEPITGRRPAPQRLVVVGEEDEDEGDDTVEALVELAGSQAEAAWMLAGGRGRSKREMRVALARIRRWRSGSPMTAEWRERVEAVLGRLSWVAA